VDIFARASRLDSNHANVGTAAFDGGRDASEQSAAAHRHHHGLHVGALFDDLEPDGPLPRDHPRMVERRHHRQAALSGNDLGPVLAVHRRPAGEHHFGAMRRRPLDFHCRRGLRHDDHRRSAQQPRRQRHRLTVVAG
jgi:hypothetical protein